MHTKYSTSELSTGHVFDLKKTETKREKSPCTPYKRKAKGKEISRGSKRTVYRGRACVKQCIAAVVEDALLAFGGTRGPIDSDEALWAAIAWRIGYENFSEAIHVARSEQREIKNLRNPAGYFQEVLNRLYPRKEVRG